MAEYSNIEWTEASWNPVTGCSKISPGCQNCYAERLARRLQAMGVAAYAKGFQVACHHQLLQLPFNWRRPRRIFVCSMSDLFHPLVPEEFIQAIFGIMNQTRHHTYQILTKRSQRLAALGQKLNWTPNIWAGVTVESADYYNRIDDLINIPAAVRFISFEPLLSPMPDLSLKKIDWVIVGGESGPKARPMVYHWVSEIKQVCHSSGVPFFFKQWGGAKRKSTGRMLDGRTYSQYPTAITA